MSREEANAEIYRLAKECSQLQAKCELLCNGSRVILDLLYSGRIMCSLNDLDKLSGARDVLERGMGR
jgi:hypothetical protein